MRGEDALLLNSTCGPFGSPPHARGRPRRLLPPDPGSRITPACAGKTGSGSDDLGLRPDHPRMRGEDPYSLDHLPGNRGSPPHARGRQSICFSLVVGCGITPACAGKTGCGLPNCTGSRDHPRMRGEDGLRVPDHPHVDGSPPHARGRLKAVHEETKDGGITPACAGKTIPRIGRCLPRRDHPRMRGEDVCVCDGGLFGLGSPPHARGRPKLERPRVLRRRITPACAGKTPPLSWLPVLGGITPACAGKTSGL